MSECVLVLDVGDVILRDPLRMLFDALAAKASVPRDRIVEFYARDLRQRLWSGTGGELEFWEMLLGHCALDVRPEPWRSFLLEVMDPLPAAASLVSWAEHCSVWGLSNHRAEWLRPALARNRLHGVFSRLWISSETGHVKPDRAAFTEVADALGGRRALFVDDKQTNVKAAHAAGLEGIVADDQDRWMTAVDRWLRAPTR